MRNKMEKKLRHIREEGMRAKKWTYILRYLENFERILLAINCGNRE